MVRLVPCGVRECRRAAIDRERETDTSRNKKRKEEQSITEYVLARPTEPRKPMIVYPVEGCSCMARQFL